MLSGRVDYYFSPIAPVIGQIQAGQLLALAVGSPKRAAALPDVPTTAEAGVPGSEFNFWIGMMAPAKTPRDIVNRLHDEVVKALASPEVKERFAEARRRRLDAEARAVRRLHQGRDRQQRQAGQGRRPRSPLNPRHANLRFSGEHHMAQQRLGLIMHGVTGRMGMNQHLIRSIVAIRAQGGVTLANGDSVMPDPILIGRNAEKIEALAKAHGIARWGTNLDAALANKDDTVFFDAGTTQMRPTLLAQAIRAGKHVYCEKPIATNLNEAVEICQLAQKPRA